MKIMIVGTTRLSPNHQVSYSRIRAGQSVPAVALLSDSGAAQMENGCSAFGGSARGERAEVRVGREACVERCDCSLGSSVSCLLKSRSISYNLFQGELQLLHRCCELNLPATTKDN